MTRIKFDLQELQSFVMVAEKLSFREAADLLSISPPALSRRIEKLESALNSKLLNRSTRRVQLTNSGRAFLERARRALDEIEKGVLGVEELAAHYSGVVTVACVPSVAYYFLPSVVVRFTALCPSTRVQILDEGANTVLSDVLNLRADFGVNFIGTQETDLHFEPVLSEPFVLAVPSNHRLARRRQVRWRELRSERFITVGKNSGNRVLLDSALANSAYRPSSFFEVAHVSSLLGLVEAGLGVAAVPKLALSEESHSTPKGIELIDPEVFRTLGLLYRKNTTLSPSAQILYDLIKREALRR